MTEIRRNEVFTVNANRPIARRCTLEQGYKTPDDSVLWAMQIPGVLTAHYTDADEIERARVNALTPLSNGDVVNIDGAEYTLLLIGDFSNCAIFVPAGETWTHDRWSATITRVR